MMAKSIRRAMREALAALREVENHSWSLRPECADTNGCVGCAQKAALREKATAAMKRLEKELSREGAH